MSDVLTAGARNFFGVPTVADLANVNAQVAFLGVPFDGGTPQPGNRTGQKLGPAAARHASWEQFTYGESPEDGVLGWYDIESDRDRLRAGGLNYGELRTTLAAIARRGRVVAFDVAELNPPSDSSDATARLATWLITHLLSEVFD